MKPTNESVIEAIEEKMEYDSQLITELAEKLLKSGAIDLETIHASSYGIAALLLSVIYEDMSDQYAPRKKNPLRKEWENLRHFV